MNLHSRFQEPGPQPGASANSATPARKCSFTIRDRSPRSKSLLPECRTALPNTPRLFFSRADHFFHLSAWVGAVQSAGKESSSRRGMSTADAPSVRRAPALGQHPGPAAANQTGRELLDRFLRLRGLRPASTRALTRPSPSWRISAINAARSIPKAALGGVFGTRGGVSHANY